VLVTVNFGPGPQPFEKLRDVIFQGPDGIDDREENVPGPGALLWPEFPAGIHQLRAVMAAS